MRKVELRMNELEKYKVIKKLVETNGNKQQAALRLGLSIRQVNRLIIGYKEFGKEFFVHGNRGRKPKHALTLEFKQYLVDLYTSKYFDCTYTLFSELLAEREDINISVDEVRNILREAYILSPKAHKCTRKAVKKELIKLQKNKPKRQKLRQFKTKSLKLKMLIQGNQDVFILVKKYKWMPLYIFGSAKKNVRFMLQLTIQLVKLLEHILINKKH